MVCEVFSDKECSSPVTEEGTLLPAGRSSEIERICARYLDSVYRFLYARVGNKEDAEDLTSETFLVAARHLDVDRSEASIGRWIFTVARTRLADHWRRYYRTGASVPFDELHTDTLLVEAGAVASDRSDRLVADILDALPYRYRKVLELRFLQGYSVSETAQELAMSPANAKVLQHRALARADKLFIHSLPHAHSDG